MDLFWKDWWRVGMSERSEDPDEGGNGCKDGILEYWKVGSKRRSYKAEIEKWKEGMLECYKVGTFSCEAKSWENV